MKANILSFLLLISFFAYSQEKEKTYDYLDEGFSLYIKPLSLIDPFYPNLGFGLDFPLGKFIRMDVGGQIGVNPIHDPLRKEIFSKLDHYKLENFYGLRFSIIHPLVLKDKGYLKSTFNVGIEGFVNQSDMEATNLKYYNSQLGNCVYYDMATIERIKYGGNFLFSIKLQKRRFLLELFGGIGLAFVKYSYSDIQNAMELDNSWDNSSLFPYEIDIPNIYHDILNFTFGLKLGINLNKIRFSKN